MVAGQKWTRLNYALALVIVILGASLIWTFDMLINQGPRDGQFKHTIVLLPKTIVNTPYCQTSDCNSLQTLYDFPGNRTFQYPGYLTITIYYSNSSIGGIEATVTNENSSVEGDYYGGGAVQYPITTPQNVVIPVLQGSSVEVRLSGGGILVSSTELSISYHY